jgi:hypothetical protein
LVTLDKKMPARYPAVRVEVIRCRQLPADLQVLIFFSPSARRKPD